MANDEFEEIAARGRETSPDQLSPIPPRTWDRDPIEEYAGSVPAVRQVSYRDRLETFETRLEELRADYRPFLRELQPDAEITRNRTALSAFEFRYETEADAADFDRVRRGDGDWEAVSIPEYRGPEGRWTGFYRTTFEYPAPEADRVYLHFGGVDYLASVYLNGRHVGSHEGVCAEFEFDVTEPLRVGANTLLVEVHNDYPMKGPNGTPEDVDEDVSGDKIMAVNTPGWDDPNGGWQCCPAGAGIFHDVFLEERPDIHVADVFVVPDLEADGGMVGVDVENATLAEPEFELDLTVHPQNFEGESIDAGVHRPAPAGPGRNDYRLPFRLDEYRLWTPEDPWLYTLRVRLRLDGEVVDVSDVQFGMRDFEMLESSEPAGELRLNGDPIRLRGTGCMGHLQRSVMDDDDEQLIEDVLIAKLANLNYFRVHQRPLQSEVYEMFDKLGMLAQTDLPLFGQLRRTKVTEAIRQVEEMGRHVRGHPSSVLATYINEAFDMQAQNKTHRFCSRPELEDFFEAATRTIRRVNPDLEIKYVEGDHNPPTRWGLSDFHTYLMWYTNGTSAGPLSIGELHAGWLPPLKDGWVTGCGEYGAEGLDSLELMLDRYPDAWLPDHLDEPWDPREIYRQQTYGMHGDWFEEQETIDDWIEASQAHQARAVRLMTDAYRRRSDRVVSSALQFLIDAWPNGWMKAAVDASRTPKPAYFAYVDALEPVRVHLRTDRFTYYAGDELDVEAWLLNDTGDSLDGYRLEAALRLEGESAGAVARDGLTIDPASGRYEGHVDVPVPEVEHRTDAVVDAVLFDAAGDRIDAERVELDVFPRTASQAAVVAYLGDEIPERLGDLPVEWTPFESVAEPERVVISPAALDGADLTGILDGLPDGATVLCTRRGGGGSWVVGDDSLEVSDHTRGGLTFVARSERDPLTADFDSQAFAYWYDESTERIDFVADSFLPGELDPVLYTYEREGTAEPHMESDKERYPVVGRQRYEGVDVYFSELFLEGRVGNNPALDALLLRILRAEER